MALTDEQILYRHIDDILWQEWDPIGINDCEGARDEYYSYLPNVWRLKLKYADTETIAQYLLKIETEHMGLNGDIEHCRKVANKINSL